MQPGLSAAIQRLESSLKVQLLERTKREVRLTQAGVAFLEEARRTLEQAERAAGIAKRAERGELGELRVGFVMSATYWLLPKTIRAFRNERPQVTLKLIEGVSVSLLDALEAGTLGLAFVRYPAGTRFRIAMETLVRERLVLAFSDGHTLAQKARISVAMVKDQPFIAFSPREVPGLHTATMVACREAGWAPKVVQEVVHLQTMVGLVSGNIGIALVPECVQALHQEGVVYRPMDGLSSRAGVELALARRENQSSTMVEAFVACARRVAQASHGSRLRRPPYG